MQLKPIPSTTNGVIALYGAGDDGQIYRLINRYGKMVFPLKPLAATTCTGNNGHRGVTISVNGKKTTRAVPSLVAEAWIGPMPAGLCVIHKNGDPLDDRPRNLKYGENARRSALTAEQALEIYHSPEKGVDLARAYGVSPHAICMVRTGHTWTEVTGHRANEKKELRRSVQAKYRVKKAQERKERFGA